MLFGVEGFITIPGICFWGVFFMYAEHNIHAEPVGRRHAELSVGNVVIHHPAYIFRHRQIAEVVRMADFMRHDPAFSVSRKVAERSAYA